MTHSITRRAIIKKIKNSAIKSLVTLSRRYDFPKRVPLLSKPSKFLVVSTTGIGDTLWGTPAIRALKETYPESYIGVLTKSTGFELLNGNPFIDEFFIFDRGGRSIFSLLSLLKALRYRKFEIAFIFHASDRIIWPLVFFTGVGEILGFDKKIKGVDFVLTRPIQQTLHLHAIEERLTLVRQMGANTEQRTMELYLTGKEKDRVEQFLKDKGVEKESLLVGLHPGAKNIYRRWPAEYFIKLGNALAEKLKCKVIITGSKMEKSLVNKISDNIDSSIPIAGDLSIREMAALIQLLSLYITNDTGPMHIALTMETPTVAMLSPSDPIYCGPYRSKGKYKMITKPPICTPCTYKNCNIPLCMEQITVEEVIAEAESLLGLKPTQVKHDTC